MAFPIYSQKFNNPPTAKARKCMKRRAKKSVEMAQNALAPV
jgi:hypothetical protein